MKISDAAPEVSMGYGEEPYEREDLRTTTETIDLTPYPGPVDEFILEPGTVVKLKGSNQPYGVVHSYDPIKSPELVTVIANMDSGSYSPMTTAFNTDQIEVYSAP